MKFYLVAWIALHSIFVMPASAKPQIPPQPRFTGSVVGSASSARLLQQKKEVSQNQDFSQPVRIIVEFKETPMFLQRQQGLVTTTNYSAAVSRGARLAQDVRRIQARLAQKFRIALPEPEIERTFHKVFYGASLTVAAGSLDQLTRLPYVKRVHFDEEVEAYLNDSVPLIRADVVWQNFGTQGEGVVVGVIDTGIDYTHPALGGGFGADHKVIGGYDLFNDDPDPMDDNSHGTHVAGIIAANAADLKGVAPQAKLMAFKVLDAQGRAPSSVVLAGIERAVDPNDDGDFADRVDIANMSLGAAGTPDDPQSTAVDNAVALGVTFCISAGNASSFYTIGSPGTARSAITVGASDKSDQMADFSSRGPNIITLSIKPDVVAPGVSITSTVPGSNVASFNGTSMSAPHVAGVAALLKSLHPDWTPARIKSAIVNSAVDLGEHVMVQGAGRVDALNAASLQAYCQPAQLNFGFADDAVQSWQSNVTLTVTNERESVQSFTAVADDLRNGIELQMLPSSFELGPGESREVEVELSVNNSAVPYLPVNSSLSYGGTLAFHGTMDSLRVPWAFNKTNQLILISEESIAEYYLTSDNWTSVANRHIRTNPYIYQEFVPLGRYDLLAIMPESNRIYMKELFNVQGSDTVRITAEDTPNLVEFRGVDENGAQLSSLPNEVSYLSWETPPIPKFNYNIRFLIDNPPNYRRDDFYTPTLLWSDSLHVSNISNRFTFYAAETYHDLKDKNHIYVAQHAPFVGISGDIRLANQPSDYIARDLNLGVPLKHSQLTIPAIEVLLLLHYDLGAPDRAGRGLIAGRYLLESGTWAATLFHSPDQYFSHGLTAVMQGLIDTTSDAHDVPFFQTKPFRVLGSRLANFNDRSPAPTVYFPSPGATMYFGNTPIYPLVEYDDLRGSEIVAFPSFYGSLDEARYQALLLTQYALYDVLTDSLVTQGDFMDPTGTQIQGPGVIYNEAPPAEYRLEFWTSGYYVGAVQSEARITTIFDTRRSDATPPTLTSFKLLNSNGVPVGRLDPGEMATIEFSAADYSFDRAYNRIQPDSTQLYIREWGTETWVHQDLEVILHDQFDGGGYRPVGYYYKSPLQDHLHFDSTAVDLKIHLCDLNGNSSDWVLAPAFSIGDFVVSVEDRSDSSSQTLPRQFALYANFPNPFNPTTTIRYDLPERTHVTLRIYNMLGQAVKVLVDELQEPGHKAVRWDGTDTLGRWVASGVYFYSLETTTYRHTRKQLLIR